MIREIRAEVDVDVPKRRSARTADFLATVLPRSARRNWGIKSSRSRLTADYFQSSNSSWFAWAAHADLPTILVKMGSAAAVACALAILLSCFAAISGYVPRSAVMFRTPDDESSTIANSGSRLVFAILGFFILGLNIFSRRLLLSNFVPVSQTYGSGRVYPQLATMVVIAFTSRELKLCRLNTLSTVCCDRCYDKVIF